MEAFSVLLALGVGEFNGHRWIPLTMDQYLGLWRFFDVGPYKLLTYWGRVTHICGKLTIIVSGNGLSPGRRQVIIWTNAEILLIWALGTNFSENLSEIYIFPFK